MRGYLITFEGPDGAGKTTVINEIIKQLPQSLQERTLVTREPGGSKISENIRTIILDPKNKEMDEIEGDSRIDMDNDFLEDTIDFSKNIIEEVNKEPMETEASTIVNENNNINIFGNISDNDTYATYKVYTVMDTDTIDGIISKYNISKELLGEYNNIEDIKSGDKLIIPSDEK